MNRFLFLFFIALTAIRGFGQEIPENKKVYLIPGQGADGRLFSKLKLDNCDTTILGYLLPERHETLTEYAKRLSATIDTSGDFYLIGVSLGGMCAVEMAKFLHPVKVIIISSAENRSELPARYKFQRVIPLNKVFGGRFMKFMVPIVRPVFEPDSKAERKTFNAMIRDKSPKFMKRSVNMIIHWDNTDSIPVLVHIHGTSDHTLPYRKIKNAKPVENGSHMMTLIMAEEISKLVNAELNK